MKRKLTKLEAFKLRKVVAESTKKQVRVVRKEDFEEGEVYAAIDMGDGATVTFDDGSLFVGPFASEEEAKAAVGGDVMLIGGDVDSEMEGNLAPNSEEGNEELDELMKEGKDMKSNMLRINKRVVESIRQRVKADIMRESEALDSLDTDADKTGQSTEDGAGAHDFKGVASFVNAKDTGPNELNSLKSDQDPAADSSEDNMLEAASYVRLESLVNVLDTKTGKKVDTGIVESVSKKGEVKVNGEVYTTTDFKFIQLA